MPTIETVIIIISPIVMVGLFITMFVNPRLFFLLLFATKPFIDQTHRFNVFTLGAQPINMLALSGIFTFAAVLIRFFLVKRRTERIEAKYLIWMFLFLQILMGAVSVFNGSRNFFSAFELFVRFGTPYFVYFIFHRYLGDKEYTLNLVKVIWLANLLAVLLSIIFYIFKMGYADISQNVARFSGFYGDSASLSLIAFTSLCFGTLYLEIIGQTKTNLDRMVYQGTILSSLFIIWVTLTKATLLITAIFIILWFGIFKKKKIIAIIAIVLAFFYMFKSESVQKRFRTEIRVFSMLGEEEIKFRDIRGVGSGRMGRWQDSWKIFINDYDDLEKFFGRNQFYKTHSQYIATLLQVGILGLVVFIFILGKLHKVLLKMYSRYRNPLIFMGFILILSMSIYGLAYISFGYTNIMWLTMILVSSINVKTASSQNKAKLIK